MTIVAAPRRRQVFFASAVAMLAPVLLAQQPSVKPALGALPLGGPTLREERPDRQVTADPQQVLAAARQAMGGEAALSNVAGLVITGNAARNLGRHTADQSIEIVCQLPDRFVRMASYNAVFGGPVDVRMILTTRDGFSGTRLIRETTSSGDFPAPPSFLPVGPAPSEAERAARLRDEVMTQKRAFARLALVLFAASPPSYPLEFSSAGSAALPNGKMADAVDAKGPDDAVMRLLVDATSHLPIMLTWKESATLVARQSEVVAVQKSAVVAVPAGGAAGAGLPQAPMVVVTPPPGRGDKWAAPGTVVVDNLAAGGSAPDRPLLEHSLSLAEYKVADGLNWPRRLVERVEGQVLEDMRLRKFKLNPKIAESKFRATDQPR